MWQRAEPKRIYRFSVYATDVASNKQALVGYSRLIVGYGTILQEEAAQKLDALLQGSQKASS